jgi:hypothetical protein
MSDDARTAEVQCRLGAELTDLDRVPEAVAAYEAALQLSVPRGDVATQALAHWGLGRLHILHYEMARARTHLDAALELLPTLSEDADLVQLLVDAVRARVFSRDHSSAVERPSCSRS